MYELNVTPEFGVRRHNAVCGKTASSLQPLAVCAIGRPYLALPDVLIPPHKTNALIPALL